MTGTGLAVIKIGMTMLMIADGVSVHVMGQTRRGNRIGDNRTWSAMAHCPQRQKCPR